MPFFGIFCLELLQMKYVLICFAILTSFSLSGQAFVDIFEASYGFSPLTGYDSVPGGSQIHNAKMDLFLPIPVHEKFVFLAGASASLDRIRLDASQDYSNLYGTAGLVGARFLHSAKWSSTHIFLPKFARGSLGDRATFQFGTLQLLEKKKDVGSSVRFGFYLNTEEYGLMLVPIYGIYWVHPDGKWEINALFPSRVDLNMRFWKQLRAGLFFDSLGSSYPIESETWGTAYVQRISNDLSLYLRHPVARGFLLDLRFGYSFFRSYRVYDAEDKVRISIANIFFDDPRTVLNAEIKDGFIFGAKLIYRFEIPQTKN
jgi:hypothetical protein